MKINKHVGPKIPSLFMRIIKLLPYVVELHGKTNEGFRLDFKIIVSFPILISQDCNLLAVRSEAEEADSNHVILFSKKKKKTMPLIWSYQANVHKVII